MSKIDPRYKRGKIYCVRCRYDDELCYVGSTIQTLSNRMAAHRSKNTCLLHKYVDGDWDNWYIELYENYQCNNKPELDKREGQITREIGNINKNIAGRTRKERYEDNKEKISEQRKQYRQDNRDTILKQEKQYRQDNKETILEKITCEHCGSIISRANIAKHKKTQKCINFKPS